MDVVDLWTLEFATADEQVSEFQKRWGSPPDAVALPVLTPAGIPFENDYEEMKGVHYGGRSEQANLGTIAYEFGKLGMDIYLLIVPDFSFAKSSTLHIVDISGDSSPQACIAKGVTRRLLTELTTTAMSRVDEACATANEETGKSASLVGVALDIVDLWPMGASDERIELTCFCQECRNQLAEISTRGTRLVREFERFPNAWNLLLQDSGTGVKPINDFDSTVTPKALLGLSQLKGFDDMLKRAGADLDKEAQLLIEYVHCRHKQVKNVVQDLFSRINPQRDGRPLSRVIVTEGSPYSWTSGTFLGGLDDPELCDELWIDPSESGLETKRIPYLAYMQRRSRYYLDAFFSFLYTCQDEEKMTVTGAARYSDADILRLLELRRRQAVSNRLASKLDLSCLEPRSKDGKAGRVGFVGPHFPENTSQKLVQAARIVKSSSAVGPNDFDDDALRKLLLKAASMAFREER